MKLFKKIIGRQILGGRKQTLPPLTLQKSFSPSSSGILPYSVDELLESKQDILDRIHQVVPHGDDHHDRYYLPLIRRYAACVHLLPASQYHHHREVGGLLSHGLEVAQHSLALFSRSEFAANLLAEDGQASRKAVSIWALGCFFAGLGHDFAKILTDMEIFSDDQNLRWNIYENSLSEWLQKHKIRSYRVQFLSGRHKKHEALTSMTLDCLLPQEIRSYLCSGGNRLSKEIFLGINALERNIISDCVIKADQISVREYMRSAPKSPSPASNTGMAPHEHLTLAINRLFSKGIWQVNAPGGVAKVIDNQLYLVWPQAARDMLPLLAADYVPAIPRDPDAVAQILLEWGIIDEGVQEAPYWLIEPDDATLKAVRLVETGRWLSLLQVTVSKYRSLGETEQQQSVTAKPVDDLQRTGKNSVVQLFLQALMSSEPPFPVQAVGQHLYTRKTEAEKWFGKNGVSRSQMLRLVREGQLDLVKIKTCSGEDKMIGPPS